MPNRARTATSGVRIALCLLAIYVGTTVIGHDVTLAQDKSTSITCTGVGPCEKTECANGDCETTVTNSSNISSTNGSDDKDSERDTRRSNIEDRLSQRED